MIGSSATAVGLVLAGALGGALVIAPGPAHASATAQGTRPCASYNYCFYENISYKGWQLQYKTTNYGDFNDPPSTTRNGVRDQVSSIINNTGDTICVYDRRTFRSPAVLRVAPYQDFVNLVDVGWNDRADYWRLVPKAGSCPGS